MIGPGLKHLARDYHLTEAGGTAYGLCHGCFLSLLEGPGYKQLSLYLGCSRASREEIASDEPTPFPPEALKILEKGRQLLQNQGCSLVKEQPALGVYPLELANGGNVLQIRFKDSLAGLISGETIRQIRAFIDRDLPQIAVSCSPHVCALCGKSTDEPLRPYFMDDWGGYAVPMHPSCAQSPQAMIEETRPEALE